ncbi:hypothetical protein RB595_004090 [Gaeumannomyces hyphopodioides]
MSGFEIAGAVLGTLPIAMAALDKYREANRTYRFWRNIRQEHKKFQSELGLQCEMIDTLCANPRGPEWKRPETEEALKSRLGTSYPHYLCIMEALETAVGDLNKELALGSPAVLAGLKGVKKPGTPTKLFSKEKMNPDFQVYRVKLSKDGGLTARKLLEELTRRNNQLETLLGQTDKVANFSQQRAAATDRLGGVGVAAAAKLDAALLSFWKSAATLYNMLQAAWSSCSCSRAHVTNMLLQHHPVAKKGRFEILLAASDLEHPWELHRALVTVGEDESRRGAEASGLVTIGAGTNPPGTGILKREPGHRNAKVLKSAMRTKAVTVASSVQPTATVTAAVMIQTPTTAEKITDLCKSLQSTDGCACVGFLHDEEVDDGRYFLYPQSRHVASKMESISLAQLISEEGFPPLSFQRRLFLSMTLASSFLQLLESPWIHHQWAKADVIFFPDPNCPGVFLLEKPHVKSQSRETCDSQKDQPGIDNDTRPQTPNSPLTLPPPLSRDDKRRLSLARLGIVLAELCFRCSIERRRAQKGHHGGGTGDKTEQEQHNLDVALAISWLGEMADEAAGHEYQGAVKWCLVDNVISSGCSDSWRREMFWQVVAPLEQSYRQFTSGG